MKSGHGIRTTFDGAWCAGDVLPGYSQPASVGIHLVATLPASPGWHLTSEEDANTTPRGRALGVRSCLGDIPACFSIDLAGDGIDTAIDVIPHQIILCSQYQTQE